MSLKWVAKQNLTSMPNMQGLLLKAALKRSSYDPVSDSKVMLPNTIFCFDNIVLDKPNYGLYHEIIGWQDETNIVHPCYLHSLAFPLHMQLLLLAEFPFPLLGLVHINNKIIQLRPISNTETLSVRCCYGELELHVKGWMFSIKVEFYSGSELVWRSISTNLFKTKHGLSVVLSPDKKVDDFTSSKNIDWLLNTDLGRRYAKVSGDFNPIHLSKWTAKLFGFKSHIIHGMWTKSYCISALYKLNPSIFLNGLQIDTSFKQPLYLPNQVNFAVQSTKPENLPNGLSFKVMGAKANEQQPTHLVGNIRAI